MKHQTFIKDTTGKLLKRLDDILYIPSINIFIGTVKYVIKEYYDIMSHNPTDDEITRIIIVNKYVGGVLFES